MRVNITSDSTLDSARIGIVLVTEDRQRGFEPVIQNTLDNSIAHESAAFTTPCCTSSMLNRCTS